jgi:hypothetical protein
VVRLGGAPAGGGFYLNLLRWVALVACAVGLLLALGTLGVIGKRRYSSETRGARPLAELVVNGSAAERAAARSVADSLAAQQARGVYPAWEWAAIRTQSEDGDTILFRIYRRQDTRLYSLVTSPWIAGGARFLVAERRLLSVGVGVR